MSTTTDKLGLIKPELTDPADITALNPNWDKLDEELQNLQDSIENKPSITVDSALSGTSTNPVQNKVVKGALDGKLSTTGGTVTGTLILSKVADADGDSYNSPALVVGGEPTTYHVELDNNEIQAKLNETTPGNLFLNSNGGKVTVGEGGLENRGNFWPTTALTSNMGTSTLPWNRINGRYLDLYGGADAMYGRLRVATTGTATTDGVTALTLGNETPSGTANNASGKITMYDKGTGFTNILPKATTSGSNTVYLPTGSGTLLLDTQGAKIQTGSHVGTGTAGVSNPLSLTFNFAPKIVMFVAKVKDEDRTVSMLRGVMHMVHMDTLSTEFSLSPCFGNVSTASNNASNYVKKSADGKTLSWYYKSTSSNADQMFNQEGYTYYWVAIG